MLLHGYLYSQFRFASIDEWYKTIVGMSLENRGRIEWQADECAGRVLVPRQVLKRHYPIALKEAKKFVGESEKDLLIDIAIRHFLAPKFQVSNTVVRIRLENEGLIDKSA